MIQFGVLLPLVAGGVASALWRQYKTRQRSQLPVTSATYLETDQAEHQGADDGGKIFDDLSELRHYQRVTWYTFAFAASGAWFYAPATIISLPLLGYNVYHFLRTLRQSDTNGRRSPLTLFEIISITGTLVTGRPLASSALLLFSFGTRKMLLQAGNISHHVDLSRPFNPRSLPIWVLRDGAEIETTVGELQQLDTVVLHPGDTIAMHGEIVKGSGVVRQFSLRREMKLLPKEVGDQVFPYTQLVSGGLHIRLI